MSRTMADWLTDMAGEPIEHVVIGDVDDELLDDPELPMLAREGPHNVVLAWEDAAPWLAYEHANPSHYGPLDYPIDMWQPLNAWSQHWVIVTYIDEEYHSGLLLYRVPRQPVAKITTI